MPGRHDDRHWLLEPLRGGGHWGTVCSADEWGRLAGHVCLFHRGLSAGRSRRLERV